MTQTTNDYCSHGYPDFGRGCPDCDCPAYLPAVLDPHPRLVVGRELVLDSDGAGTVRIRPRSRRRRGAAGLGAAIVAALAIGAGDALASPPPTFPALKCPVYREPIPPQVEGWGWTYAPAHPVGIRYARCILRGEQR